MESNKNRFVIGVIMVILISVFLVGVNLFKDKPKEEKEKTISKEETKSMLSYTLDGEKTDVKPTKEDGYIANKIICENGSNLIWDNTNWEVEIISLESNDICSVDFTKDVNTNGYRVTATTNVEGSIDSLSKSTIENGIIIFYLTEGQEITKVSGCTGVLENNKIIVSNVTSNQTCNIEVKIPKTLYVTLSDGVKYKQWIRTSTSTYNESNKTEVGFSSVLGGETIQDGYNSTGKIYKIDDNNYYFAGNPSDNWVKFAGFWWRIIRSNSTEGTRLLYAGTRHDGQDGYINNTTYKWNNEPSEYTYVYWNNSNFKSVLNSWYSNNITGINDSMVNSIQYCNDTSYVEDLSLGTNGRYFGPYTRLVNSKKPSYSCETNQFGNVAKVGLMTIDEVSFAGGIWGSNSPNTYYYRNSKINGCVENKNDPCSVTGTNHWWTMSPLNFQNDIQANMFLVCGANNGNPGFGRFGWSGVDGSHAVRPVITLKPEVKVSGEGTVEKPFIPSLTN